MDKKERIVYKIHDWVLGTRVATKNDNGDWLIFVGKQGGDLRKYKTESAMDKEMLKRGFTRMNIEN